MEENPERKERDGIESELNYETDERQKPVRQQPSQVHGLYQFCLFKAHGGGRRDRVYRHAARGSSCHCKYQGAAVGFGIAGGIKGIDEMIYLSHFSFHDVEM